MTNTGITIADNIIDHTATVAGRYGIEISRSNGVVIRHNSLVGSVHGAIGFTTRDQDVPSEGTTIEQNTITGSGGPGISVAPHSYTGPMAVHFNRIVDNDPHRGVFNDDPAAVIDAQHDWWGCNSMPGGAGCDHPAGAAAGEVEFGPWLVLQIHSAPADILAGQAAAASGGLQHDSSGALTARPFFAPVTAVFSAVPGHVTPTSAATHTSQPIALVTGKPFAFHDITAGNPFLHLASLRSGDAIYVTTANGTYRYSVSSESVVRYTDVAVLDPVPGHPGQHARRQSITLITCTPVTLNFTPWRVIVTGTLVSGPAGGEPLP